MPDNNIAADFKYLLSGKTGLGQEEGRALGPELWAMLSGQPLSRMRPPVRPELGGPPAPGIDWDYDTEPEEIGLDISQFSQPGGSKLWSILKNFLTKGFDVDKGVAPGSSNIKDLLRGGEIYAGGADRYRAKQMKEQGL